MLAPDLKLEWGAYPTLKFDNHNELFEALGVIVKNATYVILGLTCEGRKEVLPHAIGENKSGSCQLLAGYTCIKTFYRCILNLQKGLHSLFPFFYSSLTILRMSPGSQSRASQIPSKVEKRIALILLFLILERLTFVMPPFSASSLSDIWRFAIITSSSRTIFCHNLNKFFHNTPLV